MLAYGEVPGGSATLEDIITGYGKQKADIANTQAQTAGTEQQTAVNQQIERHQQLSNQASERALRDSTIIQDAYTNTDHSSKAMLDYMRRNGVTIGGLMGWQQHDAELRTKAAIATKDEHENEGWLQQQTATALNAAKSDPTQWATVRARLQTLHPDMQLPDEYPGEAKVQSLISMNDYSGKVLASAKTAAEISHTKAQTAGTYATTAETQQKTDQAEQMAPVALEKAKAEAAMASDKAAGKEKTQPLEQAKLDAAALGAAEAHRHNLSTESTARLQASIAGGHLAQEQMVNGVKYGPDTAAYWSEQLLQNPDSVKELPAEMRTQVGRAFTAKTGLPLPTPLSADGQTQERAARNALDGATRIAQLASDPEVAAQLGPIMGRLGNAEQKIGTAVGLSPQAEQKAQDLRTQMRYFVFQEGKAVLGGRLPQQLMKKLEESSASVHMDTAMLKGALEGATTNAQAILDNTDKQRFGGKMRTREQRGQTPEPEKASTAPIVQHSQSTGQYRHSLDGGKTWLPGQPNK